jgi:hypothetical protein
MHVQAITRLTLFQINSRGFKSDESGGERRVLFHIPLHTVCTVSFVWCDLKLSLITTISLPDSSRVSHSRIRRHHLTSKPFTATAQCSSVCNTLLTRSSEKSCSSQRNFSTLSSSSVLHLKSYDSFTSGCKKIARTSS